MYLGPQTHVDYQAQQPIWSWYLNGTHIQMDGRTDGRLTVALKDYGLRHTAKLKSRSMNNFHVIYLLSRNFLKRKWLTCAGVSIPTEARFTLTSVVDTGGVRTAVFTDCCIIIHSLVNSIIHLALHSFMSNQAIWHMHNIQCAQKNNSTFVFSANTLQM